MKILLIELAGIGDTVLSTPLIRNLRFYFPDAYIGYLTFSASEQLMCKSNYLDKIFILRRNGAGIFENFSVLMQLRQFKFDLVVNLYQLYTKIGAWKMAMLFNFLKPEKSIGRDTDNKGFFYNIKVKDSMALQKHDVESKLDLLRVLGYEAKDYQLEVCCDELDIQAVREFLKGESVSDSDILIGLHPGANRPSRRWDIDKFALAADQLIKIYNAKIIITGGPNERKLAASLKSKMSGCSIDVSGRFSLPQIVALFKRLNLFITNDTAPMHIANALGTPLISIMSCGGLKTVPYQKENFIALMKDVDCAPCYKYTCRHRKCHNLITPGMVINASNQLLKFK